MASYKYNNRIVCEKNITQFLRRATCMNCGLSAPFVASFGQIHLHIPHCPLRPDCSGSAQSRTQFCSLMVAAKATRHTSTPTVNEDAGKEKEQMIEKT